MAWDLSLGGLAVLVLGAAYLPASILMLPASVLTLGTGFVLGLGWGFVAVSIGSTLGSALAFLLGRTAGRSAVEAKMQSNPRFAAISKAIRARGFWIVFLLRLSPLFPFNLLNYALGVTELKFRDYLLASWLGMMPGTFLYVYLGTAMGSLAELVSGAPLVASAGSAGEKALTATQPLVASGDSGQLASRLLLFVGLLATLGVTIYVTKLARKALAEAVAVEGEAQAQPSSVL